MDVKTKTIEINQNKDGSWCIETDVPMIPTEVVNELLKNLSEIQAEILPALEDVKELIWRNKVLQIGNYFWFSVSVFLFLMLIWR